MTRIHAGRGSKLSKTIWYRLHMKHVRSLDLFYEDPEARLPLTRAYLITNQKLGKVLENQHKRSIKVQIFYTIVYQVVFYGTLSLIKLGILRYENDKHY